MPRLADASSRLLPSLHAVEPSLISTSRSSTPQDSISGRRSDGRRPAHLPQAPAGRAAGTVERHSGGSGIRAASCARRTRPAPSRPPPSGARRAHCPWPPPAPTPAPRIAPGARKQLDDDAVRRPGEPVAPREIDEDGDLIVSVCDSAREELGAVDTIHWSVPDPVAVGTNAAFDAAFDELTHRVDHLALRITPPVYQPTTRRRTCPNSTPQPCSPSTRSSPSGPPPPDSRRSSATRSASRRSSAS